MPPLQNKGGSLYSTSNHLSARKPRIFAGSAGLNLDPNAHSRTDPVKALGALLKLLTALPSRIGGCQYKLTPAEHKLSLHLVSIIDPFVCHGARAFTTSSCDRVSSLSSLVDQPTEILDAILSHVDSRKDLLSVGLVCKRLHDVIFPRHFDYRVIRCKLSSISLWSHLIIHKSLARNVRKLEILDERLSTAQSATNSYILIPSVSQHETDPENTDDELRVHSKQEKYLSEALLHMTGLEEFKWSCNHSPISIANIWSTLMIRASNLRTLEIHDNLLFGPRLSAAVETGDSSDSNDSDHNGAIEQPHGGIMTRLPSGLLSTTNVVFRSTSHSFGAAKQPDLKRISRMLQKCPQLESLEITYIPPRVSGNTAGGQGIPSRIRPLADDILTYSRWTSTLTTLVLSNVRCSTSSAPLAFLSEHPSLEVLHLDVSLHIGSFSGPNRLPQGSLPNLREVKSCKEFINAILECPCDSSRPLRTLKGFKLSGHTTNYATVSANSPRSVSDVTFLSNLKHQATLIRVELSGWHDIEDIRKLVPSIPNVQHLALGKRIGAMGRRVPGGSSGPSTNVTEWIDLLSTLPDLSTLHGIRFFYEVLATPAEFPRSYDPSISSTNASKSQFAVSQMSMMERSRMRKNDEVAGVLAWKCRKLQWVDHWEAGSGKMIHLVRDHCREEGKDKVRWEVKRLKGKC